MKRKFLILTVTIVSLLLLSCNSNDNSDSSNREESENKVLQDKDGSISLNMDNAVCYSDMVHPSSNTAEWNVVVSKSGRYDIWLSSATKDTTNMKYDSSVMLCIKDKRLEVRPACDKIIKDSKDVTSPYYRADSFVGSLYLQDTGLYNIQVISDKIVSKDYRCGDNSSLCHTKLLSVSLTPEQH